MAQKTKVKELVGRGLNSYHTKALQQMDRIKKKNKEQNHKISILSNELDNDYLTKTEEGSVISLEHSKEGMVYLDELQGNTLVNYCTDGSKELTLNGDIDVEGTFVTTTEGVDNGLVDVACEGNTLVNIANNKTVSGTRRNGNIIITPSKLYSQFSVTHQELMNKLNTTYTIRMEVLSNTSTVPLVANKYNGTFNGWNGVEVGFTGEKIFTYTTGSEYQFARWFWIENNVVGEGEVEIRLTILEGDWLDKEIPPYFEGMKSVGQDDENGHKIEILSRNKNLFNINDFEFDSVCSGVDLRIEGQEIVLNGTSTSDYTRHSFVNYLDYMKDKTTYTLTGDYMTMETTYNDGRQTWTKQITTDKSNMKKVTIYLQWLQPNTVFDNLRIRPMLEEGSVATTYVTPSLNKKEISLNEPLRGVNNVKDKFVKIGGKWFIERNCIGVQFKDLKYTAVNIYLKDEFPDVIGFRLMGTGVNSPIMCDKYVYTNDRIINFGQLLTNEEYINVYNSGKEFFITIKKAKLETLDIKGLMNYFSNNSLEIVGKADSTTYEPITDATLTTYLDTTHISNNSIIPCNMKIKNTGYNAIIKPSTLYTVALDTNYNGTIGMNLGGAKVTTTNNIATITTPATLTDDSLRLYGKDIKGSKVRLLEGDKTNWIPSFFEGMKSSFEDKLQDDGSYKMEILSSNENLFNVDALIANQRDNKNIIKLSKLDNGFRMTSLVSSTWLFSNTMLKLKPNKRYKIKFKTKNDGVLGSIKFWTPNPFRVAFDYRIHNGNQEYEYNFTTNKEGEIHIQLNTTRDIAGQSTIDITDISITELNHVENKSNKIQFSSIEPLRKWDRFVFKDNKLMIERNSGNIVLNGTESWTYSLDPSYINHDNIYFRSRNLVSDKKEYGLVYNDKLPNHQTSILWSEDVIGFGTNDKYFPNGFAIRLPRRIVGNGTNAEMQSNCKQWLSNNNINVVYELTEPTYEEIPYELQKIILEGYENGTLFFDTNIPPTATVRYAGETPIVKSVKLNKAEVLSNTEDINDNIIPYLMDMDYRVVMLQLATEELEGGVSMARLFGGTYEMIKRDILSKRLTREEYGHRLADYYNAGKLTEEQVRELEELR